MDRSGEIPEHLVDELRRKVYFGWSIPEAYGGLGLSAEELVLWPGGLCPRRFGTL